MRFFLTILIIMAFVGCGGGSNSDEESTTIQQRPPVIFVSSNETNLVTSDEFDLSARASDPDGTIVSYQWFQVDGPDLIFNDTGTDTLTITVPELTTHQIASFEVTATDNDGLTSQPARISFNVFPRYKVTTVQGREDGKGVDLVILADGFRSDELAQFQQATGEFIQAFNQKEAIQKHLPAWNIHRVSSISNESGVDFPDDNIWVDTAFDGSFQCTEIARLICIDAPKVLAVTAKLVPQFDQIMVMVNSVDFGGGGGQVVTFSLSPSGTAIAIHELGHSFAGLADEYTDSSFTGGIYEPDEPNVTTVTDPTQVKWRHWFDDINNLPSQEGESGVGLFEGANFFEKDYYRPVFNSFMREVDEPFGPVNAEAWALNVYETAGVIFARFPEQENVEHISGNALTFSIEPVQTRENNKITWWVNDLEHMSDIDNPEQLTIADAPSENYTVKVEIADASGLIRKDTHQSATANYRWLVTAQ